MIVSAKWPTVSCVDEFLVQENEFLHRSIREFRLRREARFNPKKNEKKSGASAVSVSKILNAIVYISEQQPKWKIEILNIIKDVYEVEI